MDPMLLGFKADAFLHYVKLHIPLQIQALEQDSFSDALAMLFQFRAKKVPKAFKRMLSIPLGDQEDIATAG
jgi:hypothetical protein